ncbi:MAG TPA: hypothetical protein VMW69_03965, partial [Spirochaetia bacterium]|nr:hypothetical protein [Spirochaetia bacterium]
MQRTVIHNVVILDEEPTAGLSVVLEGDRITRIAPVRSVHPSGSDRVIEGKGRFLAPGFIDLHIHGTHNLLVDSGREALEKLCTLLPGYGVTGFLPTVSPRIEGEDARHVEGLSAARSAGASIFGFFLEGPFLTLTGALPPESCGSPSEGRIRSLIEAATPYRAVFAVAPDLDGVLPFIPMMADGGAPVFITHTAATVKQTQAAIEAGARHATHFYDVFPAPRETDPGVRACGATEAILADDRVSVDFILDGEHVDPIAVKMALRCKGLDRVCLITDANLGAGLPPGVYEGVGGEIEFAYPGAPARMTKNSRAPGSLAGSGLTLDTAVRNAV